MYARILRPAALALLCAFAVPAAATAQAVNGKAVVNTNKQGLALQGYDPVAFFTEGKAVKGSETITSSFNGGTYRFASAENKATFDHEPAKYEPQFGGYCAYGVSQGHTAPIEISTFQIVDGRLMFNYSQDVKRKFDADRAALLKKADGNWPGIVAKEGKATGGAM